MGNKPSSPTGRILKFERSSPSSSKNSLRQREEDINIQSRWITADSKRNKDISTDNYDIYKQRMNLLKHMFKQLDPNVMATATYVTYGDLEIAVKFDANHQKLLVKIIQARDLQAKDLRGKNSDPYVKLWLQKEKEKQPEINGQMFKTRIMPKTLNPKWNEIFAFDIDNMQVLSGTYLVFQVWDNDITDKDDLIGEHIVSIESMNLTNVPMHTAWYSLQTPTELYIVGSIKLNIMFQKPDSLFVKIDSGENLTQKSEDRLPNCKVKLQIPGLALCYETKIKESTINPEWNEVFEFTMQPEELFDKYLIIHAIDVRENQLNESLGQIMIDLDNLNPLTGLKGSFDLADLKNTERLRSRWFQHKTLQEFRESLTAHANFHQPAALFEEYEGTKKIKMTSLKANCSAFIKIVDGIPVY